jgi:methionyl-tRNA formyltransferase
MPHGPASYCLPVLCANPALQVERVILARSLSAAPPRKRLTRKLRKAIRIGIGGALNGMRMRAWYAEDVPHVRGVCNQLGVRLYEVDAINTDATRNLLKSANPDVALSLGNSYIAPSVFSIPRYGTLNIHTEVLPAFKGAQSIIWPIYEGIAETGFTIHSIDKGIDTGRILYQKRQPITFYPTLRETVERNLKVLRAEIPEALSYVCENLPRLMETAVAQIGGKSYTTPSLRQYLRMIRKHREMYGSAGAGH